LWPTPGGSRYGRHEVDAGPKKELEKAMEEGRKKHLKMLRNVVQELTGKSLSLSDEELSDLRFPPRK
jgi:hypothetical protein